MSNPPDIVCRGQPDVHRYICPCNYLDTDSSTSTSSQQGGYHYYPNSSTSCLGAKEIPLGLNPGCDQFPPTASEMAWDYRYNHPPPNVEATGGGETDHYHLYKQYKKLYKDLKAGSKGALSNRERKKGKSGKGNDDGIYSSRHVRQHQALMENKPKQSQTPDETPDTGKGKKKGKSKGKK